MQSSTTRRLLLASVAAALLARWSSGTAQEREVRVVARKFVFEPETIHARKGEPLLLRLVAPEVPMGFNLADLGLRADVVPGRDAQLRLTPQRSGSFTFVCDVFCGTGHENMSGTLVVS